MQNARTKQVILMKKLSVEKKIQSLKVEGKKEHLKQSVRQ